MAIAINASEVVLQLYNYCSLIRAKQTLLLFLLGIFALLIKGL